MLYTDWLQQAKWFTLTLHFPTHRINNVFQFFSLHLCFVKLNTSINIFILRIVSVSYRYTNPSDFSALTLMVGRQEGHPGACKNWVVRYKRGYLSAARCKWFAYGQADATATQSSLAPVKSRTVYLSGAGLPKMSLKKAIKPMYM